MHLLAVAAGIAALYGPLHGGANEAVLRMLEQFVGPDVFRDGIRDYLTIHSHSNTETSDLWDALERSSGRPVRDIMDTWINQGGYPLVRVGEDGSLSQTPFSYRGDPGGAIGSAWKVPVVSRSLQEGDPDPVPVLLDGTGGGAAGTVGNRLVNAGGSGFYRVSYPSATVERLADATAVQVHLVDTPLECVVQGAGVCLESFDRLKRLFTDDD